MFFLISFFSITLFAQNLHAQNLDYSANSNQNFSYGNGNTGKYSSSFLSPVKQGLAGNNPKDVQTIFFGTAGYIGPTMAAVAMDAVNEDKKDLQTKYEAEVYSLFSSGYFPNKEWNMTPLVDKVYSILEGLNGDQTKAKQNSDRHRMFAPTSLSDLKLWGETVDRQEYSQKFYQYYNRYPTAEEVNDFMNLYSQIKASVYWIGYCDQFSSANADPYIGEQFSNLYSRDGQVYLCQKPITLGEMKEATTLLYDQIEVSENFGQTVAFTPYQEKEKNNLKGTDLNFLTKYAPGSTISSENLTDYARKYTTFLYSNYYERQGQNPNQLAFCDLDQLLKKYNYQDFGNSDDNKVNNKMPIMNLSGDGQVWNNAISSSSRTVEDFNIYTGKPTEEGDNLQTVSSLPELVQAVVEMEPRAKGTNQFNRMRNLLVQNYTVLCEYARDNNMADAKNACDQIAVNQSITPPLPNSNAAKLSEWANYPASLDNMNKLVDENIIKLAKSFILTDDWNRPVLDARKMPQLRTFEGDFLKRFKFKNVKLNVEYIDEDDAANNDKIAKLDKVKYEGVVLIDEKNPETPKTCRWKNVWNYDWITQRYQSNVAGNFMTLDIPQCPKDSKAIDLLEKVKKCLTFKELVGLYQEWMLEASTGFDENVIAKKIDETKALFPETNINWDKLKEQILGDMNEQFTEESDR